MKHRSDLYDEQVATVEILKREDAHALFFDMGKGKTVTMLTALDELIFEYMEVSTVLVLAPPTVASQVWSDEIQEWSHLSNLKIVNVCGTEKQRLAKLKEKAHIYTISIFQTVWLCALYGGSKLPFDAVVIDESSFYKNPKSERTKALHKALPSVKRRYPLTGTPSPNGYHDLWAQIYMVDFGERLGDNITKFREGYFYKVGNGIHGKYRADKKAEEAIQERIKDIVTSIPADNDTEKVKTIEVKLAMPEAVKKQYKTFERDKVLELIEAQDEITAINAGVLVNKLQQFANGAVYDTEKQWHKVHDIKLEALSELIESLNGKPAIVAVSFRSDAERIMERLKHLKPRIFNGDKEYKDWNAGKIPVMIMHPAGGGHGLNLQYGGHYLFWFGHTWNLEWLQQLNKRLNRPGQKNTVFNYKLILKGSIDEDILRSNVSKDSSQQGLMKAVRLRIAEYTKSRA